MKIGIDASRANLHKKTGTEWYSYHVIQQIKELADPNDQFVLYSKEPLTGDLAILPENFTSKVLHWPPGLLWTQLRLAWEMLWHAPDILFVPAHTIPVLSPKKTYTTIHDVGFERYQSLYAKKRIGPRWLSALIQLLTLSKYSATELDYHRWSTRLAVKKAHSIITVSGFSKSEITNFFPIKPERIVVIPNAPNGEYAVLQNQDKLSHTRAKLDLPQNYFLFVGRLEEKKNVATIVEAYAEYVRNHSPKTKLVLVGQPGFGYPKILDSIKKYALEDSVVQLGWRSTTELVHIMSMANAFVFPSAYEGFGIPILEAMLCGTPVITSDYGSMKEVAADCALLVNPQDSHEISKAMHRIETDTALRDDLTKRGRQWAQKFSWERTTKQVLATIRQ